MSKTEFDGIPFRKEPEHEQVAIAKRDIALCCEELLIHVGEDDVVSFLQQLIMRIQVGPLKLRERRTRVDEEPPLFI